MIAAELAVHLGADLGLDSVGRRCGTRSSGWLRPTGASPGPVLDAPGAADGVVAPLPPAPVSIGRPARRARSTHRRPRGGVGRAAGGAAPGRAGRVARPPSGSGPAASRGGRRRGRRRPRLDRARRAAAPATRRAPRRPGRQLLACGWWLPARSTTTGPRWPRSPALAGLVAGRTAAGQPPRPRRPGRRRRRHGPAAHRPGLAGGGGRARPVAAPQGGGRRLQRAAWPRGPSPTSSTPARPVVEVRMETP